MNPNSIELYKQLEQRDIELKVQIQQLTDNLNTLLTSLNAKVSTGEVNANLVEIYNKLLNLSKVESFQESEMQECEQIEQQLLAIQNDLEMQYSDLNTKMKALLMS